MTTPLKVIADRLANETSSWTSVEYRVHEDYHREAAIPAGAPLFSAYRNDIHYIETGLGERLFESHLVTPQPQDEVIQIDYLDGKLAANFLRRPHRPGSREQVTIRRTYANEGDGSSHRPDPFNSLYVGGQPIDQAILKAVSLGTSRQIGRDCDRLLFAGVRSGSNSLDIVYDLDLETSIPLKIATYPDEAMRSKELPLFTWSAEVVEQFDRHPVVTRSETIGHNGPPAGRFVSFRSRCIVDEVKFNRSYPKGTFWPTITPETKVIDQVKGTGQFPKSKGITKVPAGKSIRADDADGAVPIAGIAIFLGLAMVIAAVFLARRRK